MTDFSRSPPTVPIYDPLIDQQGMTESWRRWFLSVQATLGGHEAHGNDSILLNSDFNWNRDIPATTTQADGNGAQFSEKWYVYGADNANYSLTPTLYPANDNDQTGSTDYIHLLVSSHNGNDFYLYSRQEGSPILRQMQNRTLTLSYLITNNQSQTIKVKLGVFIYFDSASVLKSGRIVSLAPGEQFISSTVKTDGLSTQVVGASPYIDFRLYFVDLINGTADLDIHYIKAELSDYATPLYIDHAMEKVRIDANNPSSGFEFLAP